MIEIVNSAFKTYRISGALSQTYCNAALLKLVPLLDSANQALEQFESVRFIILILFLCTATVM